MKKDAKELSQKDKAHTLKDKANGKELAKIKKKNEELRSKLGIN